MQSLSAIAKVTICNIIRGSSLITIALNLSGLEAVDKLIQVWQSEVD